MKIILLYGDDSQKLTKRFDSFLFECKKRNWDVLYPQQDLVSVKEALISENLFSENKIVILEKINLIDAKFLKWFENYTSKIQTTLVLYICGLPSASFIKSLPKSTVIENYSLPNQLWKFLDSLFPGNANNSLDLLNELVKSQPVEFVIHMIGLRFRDLLWVALDANNCPYNNYRLQQLKKQAGKFSNEKLLSCIKYLAKIDIKIKTTDSNPKNELDLFLALSLELYSK